MYLRMETRSESTGLDVLTAIYTLDKFSATLWMWLGSAVTRRTPQLHCRPFMPFWPQACPLSILMAGFWASDLSRVITLGSGGVVQVMMVAGVNCVSSTYNTKARDNLFTYVFANETNILIG